MGEWEKGKEGESVGEWEKGKEGESVGEWEKGKEGESVNNNKRKDWLPACRGLSPDEVVAV